MICLSRRRGFWKQKACLKWILQGDRNTKFYHASTMARGRSNTISELKLNGEEWCEDQAQLKMASIPFFTSLFTSASLDPCGYEVRGYFTNTSCENIDTRVFPVTDGEIIVNQLKPYLSTWVSANQTSFVPGRAITDNIIITQEVIHSMNKKKGIKGWMAIKIDLEKAYDRLEWGFIDDTLSDLGLPDSLCQMIMQCVSTVSTQIL
ncbi:hypothetical protein GQ457_12G000240 [Hibiscus cannabinus]